MTRCKICGGSSRLIHKGTRDDKNIDVWECNVCKTKFLVNEKKIDYENNDMMLTDDNDDLDVKKWLKECSTDDERRYNDIKDICKDKKILDFGCGYGGFLSRIVAVAQDACGVELGRIEREYLRTLGIDCRQNIDDFNMKFDVITLFHVFEHLEDPRYWIDKFSKFLKKDGIIVVEVPNGNDALLSLYECERFADFTYWSPHLFLYNQSSLQHLMCFNGQFEPVKLGFVQRFPLSNHLYWLSKGLPGGQNILNYFNNEILIKAYEDALKEMEACDTLFHIYKKVER